MKAAFRTKYGSSSQITVGETEKPKIGDDDILVRVYATTVNRTDCAILTGKPYVMRLMLGLLKPKTPVLGTDFAGKVEAVGKNVHRFSVHDKVWGFQDPGFASQAEYMVVKKDQPIAILPNNIDFKQAAASLEGAHYAYNCLNKIDDLITGQKVLINGATGAIGSAALQMIKAKDLYITAVCNTKNISLIKSQGADKVFDYTKEDFTKDDEKYDLVLDAVGKSSFSKCKRLLKPNGIYISSELGWMAQNIFYALTTPILNKIPGLPFNKKVIFPIPSDIPKSMTVIKDLIDKGQFKAVIDRTYPIEEIADAYDYVASGQKTGNVVVTV